ncbi:MAG: 16S rRNA (cytosine967-C5)-methyltransferase, partial [Myxococcota bacterium]
MRPPRGHEHRTRRRPGGREGSPNPGRVAAVQALMAVEDGAFLEDVLDGAPLRPNDRGLAWFVAHGALRRRASIDAALRPFLRTPLGGLDAGVRATLRAATFERLHGRAQAHAVVHEAVETARVVGVGRASGLVNAVLRRVCASNTLSRDEALEHPAWIIERWTERYGVAATDAWCETNNEPPPLTLVGPDVSAWGPAIESDGRTLTPAHAAGQPVQDAVVVQGHRGPIDGLPGFAEGRFWVQDAAAVAVADLASVAPEGTVLDACAAPGGKAFRLASQGARVTAVDRSETRLERVLASRTRLGLDLTCKRHDWSTGPLPDGATYDVVLVDAPCTALGTLRRHPEVRWRRHP